MGSRRGFVFSIIAVSFMLLLMVLATVAASQYMESERLLAAPLPLIYSAATLDNVGHELADAVLPVASVTPSNDSVRVLIADSVPRPDSGYELASIKSFAEGGLAQSLHATISVNTSEVDNGSLSLKVLDGFAYGNSLNGTSEVFFTPLENGTASGAANYSITISTDEFRDSESFFTWDTAEDTTGDMNVTLVYSDMNGTFTDSGMLRPDIANRMTMTYDENGTEQMDIVLGRVASGGGEYDGSFWMNLTNGTSVSFVLETDLPPQPANASSRIVFPIGMTYSQGGVFKASNATR